MHSSLIKALRKMHMPERYCHILTCGVSMYPFMYTHECARTLLCTALYHAWK